MFKTPSGYIHQVSQVSIAQTYLKIMKYFCLEFGLTPAARSRISVVTTVGVSDDPMEKILKVVK
nr:P27 family phage terminase small subunit [Clostridium tagluense]